MIEFASTQLETPLVFAALFEVSVLGVAFYYVIEALEHRFVAWTPRYDGAIAAVAAGSRS
jgi:NitT/TauT family transport system permease protein